VAWISARFCFTDNSCSCRAVIKTSAHEESKKGNCERMKRKKNEKKKRKRLKLLAFVPQRDLEVLNRHSWRRINVRLPRRKRKKEKRRINEMKRNESWPKRPTSPRECRSSLMALRIPSRLPTEFICICFNTSWSSSSRISPVMSLSEMNKEYLDEKEESNERKNQS